MIICIREEDADKFESVGLVEGIELAQELPEGDFKLVWMEDEGWWEEA